LHTHLDNGYPHFGHIRPCSVEYTVGLLLLDDAIKHLLSEHFIGLILQNK